MSDKKKSDYKKKLDILMEEFKGSKHEEDSLELIRSLSDTELHIKDGEVEARGSVVSLAITLSAAMRQKKEFKESIEMAIEFYDFLNN
jgi:hypothetical protein